MIIPNPSHAIETMILRRCTSLQGLEFAQWRLALERTRECHHLGT